MPGRGKGAYIDRKLARHPNELPRVDLELLDTALVGFSNVDGIATEIFNNLNVMPKHIRVLVIFGRDVLSYRGRERDLG